MPPEEEKINSAQKRAQKKKFDLPPITEETFIRMIKLLLDAEPILSGAGIDVNK